jgi:hypothetical protein
MVSSLQNSKSEQYNANKYESAFIKQSLYTINIHFDSYEYINLSLL